MDAFFYIRLFLSCCKKSLILYIKGSISFAQIARVTNDMYKFCYDIGMSTNTYIESRLYDKSVYEYEYWMWLRRLFEDKKFFTKYGNEKYGISLRMDLKRQHAYQKRYNIPTDSWVGNNVVFRCSHYLKGYQSELLIGHSVKLVENVFIDWTGKVLIDDGVVVANGVIIESHTRDIEAWHNGQDVNIPSEIHIGKGVYIGSRVIILSSCHSIGENAVIAAGAIVTKDVPDNCLVAGIPAKVIKTYRG